MSKVKIYCYVILCVLCLSLFSASATDLDYDLDASYNGTNYAGVVKIGYDIGSIFPNDDVNDIPMLCQQKD